MSYLFDLFFIQQLENGEQILGVIIADYIKFSRRKKYEPLVEEGIRFKARMEAFIKNHPSFITSKKRIDPRFTRFANEMVKIYYSHFLAAYWENYSETELTASINNIYSNLTESCEIIPKKLKKTIPILVSSPGISALTTIGGVHSFIEVASSKGICVRYLQNTLLDLVNKYGLFKEDFDVFIKDFQDFVQQIKRGEENSTREYYLLANAS